MANNKMVNWFLSELPELQKRELLDQKHYDRLSEYYQKQLQPFNVTRLIKVLLGIMGSLMLVSGLILVAVNFNWYQMSRSVKSSLALLMVIIPQVFCFYYLLSRRREVPVWRESVSLALAILFGSAIAFLGQIYQLPENLTAFLIIWMISTLAIVYLFESYGALVLFLILNVALSAEMQNDGGNGLIFYLMLLPLIPYYLIRIRQSSILHIPLLNYLMILELIIGLGITLEKSIPGMWMIAYSSLFVIFYLVSFLLEKNEEQGLFHFPLRLAGVTGIGLFAYMVSYHWPWEDIGWAYSRTGERFHEIASLFDYFASFGLVLIVGLLAAVLIIKKRIKVNWLLVSFAPVVLSTYLMVSLLAGSDLSEDIASWVINFYIILLTMYTFYQGYHKRSILDINISFALLVITVVTRFFIYDFSFMVRGMAIFGTGLVITLINVVLSKRLKEPTQ